MVTFKSIGRKKNIDQNGIKRDVVSFWVFFSLCLRGIGLFLFAKSGSTVRVTTYYSYHTPL